jgi:hypothetical protein
MAPPLTGRSLIRNSQPKDRNIVLVLLRVIVAGDLVESPLDVRDLRGDGVDGRVRRVGEARLAFAASTCLAPDGL